MPVKLEHQKNGMIFDACFSASLELPARHIANHSFYNPLNYAAQPLFPEQIYSWQGWLYILLCRLLFLFNFRNRPQYLFKTQVLDRSQRLHFISDQLAVANHDQDHIFRMNILPGRRFHLLFRHSQ